MAETESNVFDDVELGAVDKLDKTTKPIEPHCDGETNHDINLLKIPSRKALVWKYFRFSSLTNKHMPVCSLCYKEVLAKNLNTSNLYSHLKYKHPTEYLEVKPQFKRLPSTLSDSSSSTSQASIVDAFEKCKVLSTTSKEHKELTDAVTRCLPKDGLPIYTVEKKGFVEMLHCFNP